MTARLNRRLARAIRSTGGGGGSYSLNYTVTQTGWLTAPIAALQGEIPSGGSVSIGGLSAQLDPLNKWPDNSLKYGAATVKMTSTGVKTITNLSPPPTGSFTPTAPVLTVTLTERANSGLVRFAPRVAGYGTSGSTAYNYRYSAVASGGHESFPGFVSINMRWNTSLSPTNYLRLQGHLPAGSVSAKVYGRTTGEGLLATVTASTPSITSITSSGTTATITFATAHNLLPPPFYGADRVTVSGCAETAYNGMFVIETTPTPTTATYSLHALAASPATGSPAVTYFLYTDDGSATPSGAFKTSTVDDPGTVWTATLGSYSGANKWFDGPLCIEWQKTVNFIKSGPVTHDFATATFDVRSFNDGDHRVNVRVQTARDGVTMDQLNYDVAILNSGSPVTTQYTPKTGYQHYSLSGWQQFLYLGSGQEATFTFDFTKFISAKLVPKIMPGVANLDYTVDLADPTLFGLGKFGYYRNGELNAPGGAAYLAPIDNWSASYLVHQSASQRAVMLHHAYNAYASWTLAVVTRSDDTLYRLDDVTEGNLRMNTGPAYPASLYTPYETNLLGGNSPWRGGVNGATDGYEVMENEHMPPVGLVAYYTTADRCYLDVAICSSTSMVFQCDPGVGQTWPDLFDDGSPIYNGRKALGGYGIQITYTNDPRACARTFRNSVYAAQMCPDSHPLRTYLIGIVNDTYAWLANYDAKRVRPGSVMADGMVWTEGNNSGGASTWYLVNNAAPGTTIRAWYANQNPYGSVEEAWAVYWGQQQGIFTIPAGAVSMGARLCQIYIPLTTNPDLLNPGMGLGVFAMTGWHRSAPGALPLVYPTFPELVQQMVTFNSQQGNEQRFTVSVDVATKTLTASSAAFYPEQVGFQIGVWGPYGSHWTEQQYRDFGSGDVRIALAGAYTVQSYISPTQITLTTAPASVNETLGTVAFAPSPPRVGAGDGPQARIGIHMCDYWGVAGAATAKAVAAAYDGGELETTMQAGMPGFAIEIPQ